MFALLFVLVACMCLLCYCVSTVVCYCSYCLKLCYCVYAMRLLMRDRLRLYGFCMRMVSMCFCVFSLCGLGFQPSSIVCVMCIVVVLFALC